MTDHVASAAVRPVTLEPSKEPEYFHKLVNIERHPEFLPVARNLAKDYLEGANFQAGPLYHEFEYTEARFDERLEQIYDGYVASIMYTPHWLDTGIFVWPDESGEERTYSVGRFSDRAVVERLRQLAPLNLVDGAWLQHIVTVGPADQVQANLFTIWNDEAGNGEAAQNHASLYDALLKSVNVHLPPMTSPEFAEYPFLPGAFRGAVFQLSTGLFPGEFFPELLGMTLFLEWESTPTLAPMVRMLAARHINPHFYRIHVAVDNTVGGHGALAKEAVKLYLKQKREEGGERLVQASWRRIWRGYVTWATIGGLGGELAERLFAIDHKTINVSATPGQRTLWPDLQRYHGQRMAALIQRKAPVAKQVHGGRAVAGAPLSELFGDPPRLMEALVEGGYVDVEHPRRSRFLELLAFENGPMYKVFTPAEREIIMDWMESLRPSPGEGADPIEEDTSEDLPARMAQVVAKYAPQARMAHVGIHLTGPDGHGVPLVDLFDRPRALLQALSTNGWVVPGAADRSLFVTRVASNGGPMDGVIDPPDLEIVRRWIDAGAHLPPASADHAAASVAGSRWPTPGAASRRQRIGMGAVH